MPRVESNLMNRDNLLIVGNSERDANLLYAVGMLLPDDFVYLRLKGKCHVVLTDIEAERARQHARHCRVVTLGACQAKLRRQGHPNPTLSQVIQLLLRQKRVRQIFVPENFPLAMADALRALKIKVKVKAGTFFPERETKTADEVKKISAALMMAEVGLAEGMQALKNSKVGKNRRLFYHNVPLTSEKLRGIIGTAILQAGGLACHTIVAGGKQACDPHYQGHGTLRANEPIVIDVFPRSQKTGYFGDITRTVVKGRASEAVRRIYATVQQGQALAFSEMQHRSRGSQIHERVQGYFEQQGYKTGRADGQLEGFFHGTGHGLGLEIHEAPRVATRSPDLLLTGHVVTVEPGLYYREMGGVRLEDVILVTGKSPRNLTKFEKVLEI